MKKKKVKCRRWHFKEMFLFVIVLPIVIVGVVLTGCLALLLNLVVNVGDFYSHAKQGKKADKYPIEFYGTKEFMGGKK